MKFNMIYVVISSLLFANSLNAQAPEGFTAGNLLLADGSQNAGWIKENFKKNATIQFINGNGKSSQYNGSQLNGVSIGNISFQCINGDFFKVICQGKLCFLQKQTHAAGKTIYNGSEPIVLNGTSGKIGDYFFYQNQQLVHISAKNLNETIQLSFANCNPAIDKAKGINGNIASLADAVTIYNQINK